MKYLSVFLWLYFFPLLLMSQDLRIMTYNLRLDVPQDSADNWQYRKVSVAQLIQKHQPDILGTQEGLSHQITELASLLPDYQWIGVGRDDGKQAGEMMAIFYRKDKLEILNSGHFWLSEQPEIAGTRSWESACARMLTWAQFRHRKTQKVFFHFNSHFDHWSAKARKMGALVIQQKLPEISQETITIFTADMNFTPKDSVYSILKEKWVDSQFLAKKVKHNQSTFNAFKGRRPEMLIDYVWISDKNKVIVKSYEVDESKKSDGRFPSDHFPVIVQLKIL